MLTLDLKEKLVNTMSYKLFRQGKTFKSKLAALLLLLFCAIGAHAHSPHARAAVRAHSAVVTHHGIHQHRRAFSLPRHYIQFNVVNHRVHRGNHHHSHHHHSHRYAHGRTSRIVLRPQIVVIRPVRIVHR
jgi:hypothetical protein